MPSLILENTDPISEVRAREGIKLLRYARDTYNIYEARYKNIEFIFRQCLMHEKFNTPFIYEHEEPIKFPIKKDSNTNSNYLDKIKTGKNYGMYPLSLEKMDRIKSAKEAIKNDHANIDKMNGLFLELQKNKSTISPKDVLAYLNEWKIKTNKDLEEKILNSKKHTLRKFIRISKNGEITVLPRSFDFFKVYSLLMYCLFEPYFLDETQKDKRRRTYGINGFIARKLKFEFGNQLGFNPTSDDVSSKIADNYKELENYKKKLKALGIYTSI